MWWGRWDRRKSRVLGQIRAGARRVMRSVDGGGRQVVGQSAEDEVCLVDGVGGRVGRVHVSGVGLGVCVGVGVGVRQGEGEFGTRQAPPSDGVVQSKLRVRGVLGERRKGGGTPHYHVAVTTR